MNRIIIVASLFILAAALLPAFAVPGEPGHKHLTFSAGAPGNPKKPSRVIVISMREGDGKMLYSPDKISVRKGEQIRFILKNEGELDHEFLLATKEENLKHAELMKRYPEMEHDDPNGKSLKPKTTSEILWRFTKAGEFEFACLIPGHREAGMLGKIIVK